MPRSWLSLLASAFVVSAITAASRGARAGAFLLPEGQGQFIAGVGYVEASRRFDATGIATKAPAFSKAELGGYLEYGATSWLSLILAPTVARERDAPATNTVTGSDGSAFGARLQLYGTSDRVVAIQVLYQPPIGGLRNVAGELRLLYGQAFSIAGYPGFVDLQPGVRLRDDPYPIEARFDLTIGIRPIPPVLLLLQDFTTVATRSGEPANRLSYNKAQISLVYDVSPAWSVQFGAVRTLSGRNIVREFGPIAAVWRRF